MAQQELKKIIYLCAKRNNLFPDMELILVFTGWRPVVMTSKENRNINVTYPKYSQSSKNIGNNSKHPKENEWGCIIESRQKLSWEDIRFNSRKSNAIPAVYFL